MLRPINHVHTAVKSEGDSNLQKTALRASKLYDVVALSPQFEGTEGARCRSAAPDIKLRRRKRGAVPVFISPLP